MCIRDSATTAAIARRANVAEIQLFRYFPSKADLFREAIFTPLTTHFRTFNAMHSPEAVDTQSIRERARLYLAELQLFLGEHARMLISLFVAQTYADRAADSPDSDPIGLQAFLDESAALMTQRAGHASDIDPSTLARVAFGALLGCITYKDWLFPQAKANQGEIDRTIAEFILTALGPYSDIGPMDAGRP